jgi:DNA-binding transcriptional regulator YdaS (Cro superfamily)
MIQEAIEKAGGMRALARAIGIKYQSIQAWRDRIPAERVLDVERATGIPREKLRPDMYGKKK